MLYFVTNMGHRVRALRNADFTRTCGGRAPALEHRLVSHTDLTRLCLSGDTSCAYVRLGARSKGHLCRNTCLTRLRGGIVRLVLLIHHAACSGLLRCIAATCMVVGVRSGTVDVIILLGELQRMLLQA